MKMAFLFLIQLSVAVLFGVRLRAQPAVLPYKEIHRRTSSGG